MYDLLYKKKIKLRNKLWFFGLELRQTDLTDTLYRI